MGPRSIDRGNVLSAGYQIDYDELQWGRDQLIAEIKGGGRRDTRDS